MNAIAPVAMGFGEMERLAVSIAKSNMFGMKTPEQALVLMAIAQAEGRHPALAARDYDVIQGRPSKKAEAMLRDFLEAGGKVEWHELSDQRADATFTHPQTGSVRIDWDMDRARTAGMGGKDNWKKFPRQMLRSRVVSEGVRTLWPLATSGMYVPEEVADMAPPHNGPTIDHDEPEQPAPLKAAAASMPRGERVADPAVYDTHGAQTQAHGTKPQRTRGSFLDALEIALRDAQSAEDVDRIVCGEEVMRAKEVFTNGHKERLDRLIGEALSKWWVNAPEPETEQADA